MSSPTILDTALRIRIVRRHGWIPRHQLLGVVPPVSAGTFNSWQTVAVLGAVQGVIVAMALAAKRPRRTPHLLLAAAVLAFACHLATVVYYSADLVPRR